MAKNAFKASILAWLALLFFVFSCGSEAERERARVEREIEVLKDSSIVLMSLISERYSVINSKYSVIDSTDNREILLKLGAAIKACQNDSVLNSLSYKARSTRARLDSLSKYLRGLNETVKLHEKPKIDDYLLCMDEVARQDTIGYQSCCETNNACWNEVDSLGFRLFFPVLREYDFPSECQNYVEQKDSLAYYACCKKYNACWVADYDESNKRTIKQLEYEVIQRDSSYYDPIKRNLKKSIERILSKHNMKIDSICGSINSENHPWAKTCILLYR